MLGAIIGDMVGSPYEFKNIKSTDFPLFSDKSKFTDDTVCTAAIASAILDESYDYKAHLLQLCPEYRSAGYGKKFADWLVENDPQPYQSWGNGAPMRVSPVGFAAPTLEWALEQATKSCMPTHDHIDAIEGAKTTAGIIFLARKGSTKEQLKTWIKENSSYKLEKTCDEIRPSYKFDVSTKGSMEPAIQAFLESTDFESAVRLAVSLGGDSDTIACITGSLAQAFYKTIPDEIVAEAAKRLDSRIKNILLEFMDKYPV